MRLLFILIICLLLIPSSAQAKSSYTFSPKGCDFAITFPEEPDVLIQCPQEGFCVHVAKYSKVIKRDNFVSFQVSCAPMGPNGYSLMDEANVDTSLIQSARPLKLVDFDTTFSDEGHFRKGSLTGGGLYGEALMVHSSHLWVSPQTIFTVESEIIGAANTTLDTLFKNVLSSLRFDPSQQPEGAPVKQKIEPIIPGLMVQPNN